MALTPMMLQYLEMHDKVQDAILFFRLGDFYEMFFDDAVLVSRELELTLTGRDCGLEERAPMCGVPFHSADGYIAKLVEKGYKVAICEQVEDPNLAKGLVKRDIIRIISPGTMTDNQYLNPEQNNFLMSIYGDKRKIGCAYLDLSTGEFFTTEYKGKDILEFLLTQFSRYRPSEVLIHSKFYENEKILKEIKSRFDFLDQPYPAKNFELNRTTKRILDQFKVYSIEALGLGDKDSATKAAGALLLYIDETQKREIDHINHLQYFENDSIMSLDSATIRNLELTRTIRSGSKKGSLLGILDQTVTAAGSRLLASMVEAPLINSEQINNRLDRTEELYQNESLASEIRSLLSNIYDLERICSKLSYGNIVSADLISLKQSIKAFSKLTELIQKSDLEFIRQDFKNVDLLTDIYELLDESISEEQTDKRFGKTIKIKKGYNQELDKYRKADENGQKWLERLEETERKETGINVLKLKHNKVFGYFLEVPNGKKDLVPERYIRKQTLSNSERYFTPELKKLEEKIEEAQEKLEQLEAELYSQVVDSVKSQTKRIQKTAKLCAHLDVFQSFAKVSLENNYIKPVISSNGEIHIINGRHPVVEKFTGSNYFISNDTNLTETERILLITGPNMAGKSTYIRQNALIVLMAQIGCFVPAAKAEIGIVDRIFTRVGASDDLATGQSTFMVEMTEVSNILKNATQNSLVILDEIGRGTSTFDGISIAWAIVENLLERKIKTLFATHYHELTELEEEKEGLINYSIDVLEEADQVIFLRKIKRGKANQSYGVEVAKLAGFPNKVLRRANQILKVLEEKELNPTKKHPSSNQLNIFSYTETPSSEKLPNPVIEFLDSISPDDLTPREAHSKLYELLEIYRESK